MSNNLFNIPFLHFESNIFSITDYNTKKNITLKNELYNIKFDKINDLYFLIEQYNLNKKRLFSLKSIKEKIQLNIYDIKGILYNHNESFSLINKYTEPFLDGLKYDIKLELYKISEQFNNKILLSEKNKYTIIISNINEDTKKFLLNHFLYYFRPVLLFTNLEASIELNHINGKMDIIFRNTFKTKIYMEINNNKDIEKSKKNFLPSGIYIDYLKLNEFSYIDWINTEKLFFGKKNITKIKTIKSYNLDIDIDLKSYLEIETDSLYIENNKDEFCHYNIIKNNNINICCYVKNISEDKNRKIINITLENLFDLNNILLEIPKEDKMLDNLYINCIYIFINLIIFIDEKMNIKFTIQKNKSEKSEKIFLYFLIDPEKYYNKKLDDFLIKSKFSQLLPLITNKIIIRTIQKYFVIIDKIIYINIYLNDSNEISFYNGLLHCSDGTCSAFLRIKGNNFLDLEIFKINLNYYLYNKNNIDKKISIYPSLEDNIQVVVIGNPFMENIKEISFVDIYENINILKKSKNNLEQLLNSFDLLLSKNEFTTINGVFSKYSSFLEPIPIIKVFKIISSDEFLKIKESQKNRDNYI